MDRKQQLRNVAFGGAWSEQIAGREAIAAAIETLKLAAAGAARRDPRSPETSAALDLLCKNHPKGDILRDAWRRGATWEPAPRRIRELARIAGLLAAGHGDAGQRSGNVQ